MLGRTRFTMIGLLVLVALAGTCLGLTAASAGAAESISPAASPSASDGSVVRVGWVSSVDSLNPFVGQSTESYTVYHLNYDFLVRYDADTLEPIPGLAESWTHSSDGKTWTFKLRKDVTWQDGEPFTSRDVVFTYTYIIDNELDSYTGYTKGITKVVASDDYTVVFTCEKPKRPCFKCGSRSCRSTFGPRSRPRMPRTSSRTCRRVWVPAPSRS